MRGSRGHGFRGPLYWGSKEVIRKFPVKRNVWKDVKCISTGVRTFWKVLAQPLANVFFALPRLVSEKLSEMWEKKLTEDIESKSLVFKFYLDEIKLFLDIFSSSVSVLRGSKQCRNHLQFERNIPST